MGSLTDPKYVSLVLGFRDKHEVSTLVETGTHEGLTARWAAEHFVKVYTCEKERTYYERLLGTLPRNVFLVYEDSRVAMPNFVRGLTAPTIFWLDAHAIHANDGDDCPVMDELRAICESHIGLLSHLILIDDAACYVPGARDNEVWPTVKQIEDYMRPKGWEMDSAKDTLVLYRPEDRADVERWFIDKPLPLQGRGVPRGYRMRGTATNGPQAVLPLDGLKHDAVFYDDHDQPERRLSRSYFSRENSYTEVLNTDYGFMLVNRNDTWQYSALKDTGRSLNHDDISLLRDILMNECRADPIFFDVGANFGCYAFGVRDLCHKVFAFEAQRIIYNMLCGSIALNAWENVYAYHAAVGSEPRVIDIPQFDYSKTCSFGSIEFGKEQNESLQQKRQYDPRKRDLVPVVTLDGFHIEQMDIIKIDVEGMEQHVLKGAEQTIRRCRPMMLIEYIKSHPRGLREQIEALDYRVTYRGGDLLCYPKPTG